MYTLVTTVAVPIALELAGIGLRLTPLYQLCPSIHSPAIQQA